MHRRETRPRFRLLGLLLVLAGAVLLASAAFRSGPAPTLSIEAGLPGIGKRTPLKVAVREGKRGLVAIKVELVQGERVESIEARTYRPRAAWQLFWGPRTPQDSFSIEVGSETIKGLKEGPATIRVTAQRAGAWFRSPAPSVKELELPVRLRPPMLHVVSSFTFVKQGGVEAVVYSVGPTSVEDGVRAGEWWFRGYPLPGGGDARFALFGAPYDLDDATRIRLVARDDVGNESQAPFIDQFTRRPLRTDRIEVTQTFMERVVPAILSQTPEIEDRGDLLQNYLEINRDLRAKNNTTLVELAKSSAERFLWTRPFIGMRNGQVMSEFADRRSYVYEGRQVDQQDHLGFDLASTKGAEIEAANDGTVALARYFGIYGNAVVLDHGYGLMSLYGHLSTVAVKEGDRVTRGQIIGRSGETGLAGGDHLHFTMLLQGLPVDPREWWDGHWIHDRLVLKLGAALPFAE